MPELKLVKSFMEAYQSLDIKSVALLVAKNYKFLTYPKVPDHPQETKEQHFEKYGPLLSVLVGIDVSIISQRGTVFELTG